MKHTIKWLPLLLAIAIALSACGQPAGQTTGTTTAQANEKFLQSMDVDYSYNFAKSLEEIKSNEKLGYRTAGSAAEIATGQKIFEEMQKIGLAEVAKDEFTLDTWEFEKAELTFTTAEGQSHTAVLGGYQTNIQTNGPKEVEVLYAGKATKHDLAQLDVTGKWLLVEMNQYDEWWVSYPALAAKSAGAAGILAEQTEDGYGQISPDSLNANDICGPHDAPALSMSRTDAGVLMAALEKNSNLLTATLDASSTVTLGGKAYNISGKILGKDKDSYILVSGHYDSYFAGFQDDNAAIGMLMGIAKGLIDSGYQPEKTIIFNALAAEEWGVSNTRYDWSTGAYNQIFRIHPEWQGKAVANINFELPAYEHKAADEIRSVYELSTYLKGFVETLPAPEGVYPEGVNILAPLRTWSDDYSFSIAGVPALRNDFQDAPFSRTHYHSQFDNSETYNKAAYQFHHMLYGMLTIYYDRTCVVPLDFTVTMQAMQQSIEADVFAQAGVDQAPLAEKLLAVSQAAQALNQQVEQINTEYRQALESGDAAKAAKLYTQSRSLNAKLLEAFRFAQDNFNRLTWEDVQKFPHQLPAENLANLYAAQQALQSGDVALAVDEYLWAVDNNWYAYDWDRQVYDYFTNYVLNQPADRLMWGAGRVVGHVDLFDSINSLLEKYDAPQADVTAELADIAKAIADQQALLQSLVANEVAQLTTLEAMLTQAA